MKKMVLWSIIMTSYLWSGVVYETDFEDCTDSIPPGWLLVDGNGDGYYFAARENSSYSNSGSWFIRYASYYASLEGDDWAISPPFYLEGNKEDTLIFYVGVGSSSYAERLKVYLIKGNGPSDTVKLLWKDYNLTNTSYEQKTVIFRAPSSGLYRIGFYSNSLPGRMGVWVDDVSISAPDITGTNLAIDAVFPYYDNWTEDFLVSNTDTFTVVVKNNSGAGFVNTRTYYRVDSAGSNIVSQTQIGWDNISSGDTFVYTFTFSPSIYHMAEYDIYVYHDKGSDSNNTYKEDDTFHIHLIVRGHQGKDAYGWIWRDSYSLLGAPGNVEWIELSTDPNATNLGLDDEGNTYQLLASSIKFYGNDYYGINIDPNGIISFDQEPTGYDYINDSIPSSNASAALMPFWEDLDPSAGGAVYYRTFGDTLTVVEWYNVPVYNYPDSTFTFQVQIQSNLAGSGVYDNITFLYYNMQYDEDIMDATIGIQDSSAQNGSNKFLYYTFNEQPYIPNWKFTKGIFAIKFYSPEALGICEIPNKKNRSNISYILGDNILLLPIGVKNNNVKVWDISGRLIEPVYRWKDNNLYIDFTNLNEGIYYIKIPETDRLFKVVKVK